MWSVHCHNDLGLAVSIHWRRCWQARQVECTINGLGERAGNAALEEIVMAVRTRPDIFQLEPASIRDRAGVEADFADHRLSGAPTRRWSVPMPSPTSPASIRMGCSSIARPTKSCAQDVGWTQKQTGSRQAFRPQCQDPPAGTGGTLGSDEAERGFAALQGTGRIIFEIFDEDLHALVRRGRLPRAGALQAGLSVRKPAKCRVPVILNVGGSGVQGGSGPVAVIDATMVKALSRSSGSGAEVAARIRSMPSPPVQMLQARQSDHPPGQRRTYRQWQRRRYRHRHRLARSYPAALNKFAFQPDRVRAQGDV